MRYDVVIVGGGIAGLTAAAYVSRAGRSVLICERQGKVGGLVQTFERNKVVFDAGLRSIEDSGIVLPMLRQLGIEIDWVRSPVSVGIADRVIKIESEQSLIEYEAFLQSFFPENEKDVSNIIAEIRKIMGYMNVLYGIDNPAFLNLAEDRKYLLRVILPWMFKFLLTVRKINRLKEPVEDYLRRLTKSQALVDMIAQHFFKRTPTSFALSYFKIYLDYHYPKGGTGVLIEKMQEYILRNGGEIRTSCQIDSLQPEEKFVMDSAGNRIDYDQVIWAADMKLLYGSIPVNELANPKLKGVVEERRALLRDLQGNESVFTLYLTLNQRKEYFSEICTGHFFYTPDTKGLSQLSGNAIDRFLNSTEPVTDESSVKRMLSEYLYDYCRLNTFEISIPALRDATLAPEDQTGLIVSLLFDYRLSKKIEELGWMKEMKENLELNMIKVLDDSIFPGIGGMIAHRFSSTPLTYEMLTGNTDGGITGWAFTNPFIPVVHKTLQVAKSVDTPIPNVYQAGQWVFSPSGLPISILTGKLASDKVLKGLKSKHKAEQA